MRQDANKKLDDDFIELERKIKPKLINNRTSLYTDCSVIQDQFLSKENMQPAAKKLQNQLDRKICDNLGKGKCEFKLEEPKNNCCYWCL
jgi:hypothetical protein